MNGYVRERKGGRDGARVLFKQIVGHLKVDGRGLFFFCHKRYRGPVVAAAIYPALEGENIVVVDGGNMFDPYVISRVSRMLRIPPERVLPRFFVSRAFTCHQLEKLLSRDLKGFIEEKEPSVLIIVGLLNTFYDSDVPLREAETLFRRVCGAILSFSRKLPVMVISSPPPPAAGERERFFHRIAGRATRVYVPEEPALHRLE